MSRLGKKGIDIPEKTEVTVDGNSVSVKGPKGELSRDFTPHVTIEVKDGRVSLVPTQTSKLAQALWGTYTSHISNMIAGVNEGYEKKLVIEGVGFKADASGKNFVLNVGFSHPVEIEIPEGIEVKVEKNTISISGIDKEKVGQFTAEVRAQKKPEPYKGKGIRYENEIIRRKEGKKTV